MKTYDELLAERDALVAQVEALSDALKSGVRLMRTTGQYSGWHEKADEAESLVNQELTTQQCLAEIKAEAVMNFAAFVFAQYESGEYHVTAREKYRQLNSRAQGQTVSVHNDHEYCGILGNAEKYAAKVREGGE